MFIQCVCIYPMYDLDEYAYVGNVDLHRPIYIYTNTPAGSRKSVLSLKTFNEEVCHIFTFLRNPISVWEIWFQEAVRVKKCMADNCQVSKSLFISQGEDGYFQVSWTTITARYGSCTSRETLYTYTRGELL